MAILSRRHIPLAILLYEQFIHLTQITLHYSIQFSIVDWDVKNQINVNKKIHLYHSTLYLISDQVWSLLNRVLGRVLLTLGPMFIFILHVPVFNN